VNFDNSLVVTITVNCYLWAPSSSDHIFTCCAISSPPQYVSEMITISFPVGYSAG